MTKHEFLEQLRIKLKRLPSEEIENAVSYYNEYFEDAGLENEQKVIKELGSPSEVAANIISEFATKNIYEGEKTAKKGFKTIWLVLLGIFASPIALPIAIAAFIIIIAAVIVIFSLILSFGAAAVSLIACGAVAFISSIFLLFGEFATSVLFIGIGICLLSLGLLMFIFTVYFTKLSFNGIAKFTIKLLERRKN